MTEHPLAGTTADALWSLQLAFTRLFVVAIYRPLLRPLLRKLA